MKKINIIDNQFAHGTSLGSGDLKIYPSNFEWNRDISPAFSRYTFVTEESFLRANFKTPHDGIAFMIEPACINPESYRYIRQNYSDFVYVLSHDKEFLKQIPNGLYYPFGGCWIEEKDRQVYPKTKFMSIIASGKKEAPGHRLRHEVIENFAKKYSIDVFGRGYKPVDSKLEALKDYYYTIVIENESSKGWFTEKLIDALQCGCIPLYWGAPDINEYFGGVRGIFNMENIETIFKCGEKELIDHYNDDKKLGIINKMFENSKKYCCPEDWIFENYPYLFE